MGKLVDSNKLRNELNQCLGRDQFDNLTIDYYRVSSILAELEKEASKPKLVWVELYESGWEAKYNSILSFFIMQSFSYTDNCDYFMVQFSLSIYKEYKGLGRYKQLELGKQACEDFLSELISPKP